MASDTFDEDGLTQANRLLDEIEADRVADVDHRLLRVLRILRDQLEEVRCED